MKITLLSSAFSAAADAADQYLTTFLVNDRIAIDAGSLGFYASPRDQAAVRHVFLSHSHIDHLASLPIFLENTAGLAASPVVLHTSEAVQQCLRDDLFAGRLWPNFLELEHDGGPFVRLNTLEDGKPVDVEGLRITPIRVDHVVPTFGFLLEDDRSAVVIPSDTGPTAAIWARAAQTPHLKAVFLEATFPNDRQQLARATKHLTPADFVGEMRKMPEGTPFYAVHLKAQFRAQIVRELQSYRLPNLTIAPIGMVYEF